ncbi:protein EARLY-RESPONSIVE TO DEHYDRATION 7, chloroplastic-like [Andrographis paniculata]|uniref:protein EARLY-RESPONSIVE TO DEHYDRATION 7, chloroplastic-like n=1 Tax=Andrographis paniculata TaxID=175694 RepID=UPI0021E910A2|nr:protein EARLY-RESPONSIVE TO DEHYDRATION 7, chloroplastic-like [Andrographis paniculata]
MASKTPNSLYPEVVQTNPDSNSPFLSNPRKSPSQSSALYPTIEMNELAKNLFPDAEEEAETTKGGGGNGQKSTFESSEEVIVRISGAIVHLIDKEQSVELAHGELMVVQLKQGDNIVAALVRIGDEIQWPLAKDEAAVKLDDSHYFFTLRVPAEGSGEINSDSILNYGLTVAAKGQEGLVEKLDAALEKFSAFRVEKASAAAAAAEWGEVSPAEMDAKKEVVEKGAAAYWTTLAPNVEEYSSGIAKMIAAGSGQMIRGILWCGDVTVDRLNWGHEFFRSRLGKTTKPSQLSPQALRRMRRVKRLTKMSENVATGILSGVVKVSGFFTSSVANSKVGQKFFNLLPGEIILASLDGFNKVCDAVEVSGKNVMTTTSVVTTGLVSHRYGEDAGKATEDGLGAAGHAIGTAWAVFKIRKALNPKGVLKPTTLVKAAAAQSSKGKSK